MQAIKLYDTNREYAMAETILKQRKLLGLYKLGMSTIGFLLIIQSIFLFIMLEGTK